MEDKRFGILEAAITSIFKLVNAMVEFDYYLDIL